MKKIKKHISYLIILIALMGFLSPISILHAQTNTLSLCKITGIDFDTCDGWSNTNNPIPFSGDHGKPGTCTLPGWSQDSCAQQNNIKNSTFGTMQVASFTPASNSGTTTDTNSTSTTTYTLLQPLPNIGNTFDASNVNSGTALTTYLNAVITIFIGICGVLAVIMIVMGGIEYMTSELPGNKEDGKQKITNALFGLVLALLSWTLLNTINPDLLNSSLSSLKMATINVALTPEQQIQNYTGGGTCAPVTNTSSPCSVANLAPYGFAGDTSGTQASSICNGESNGTTTQLSGTDVGSDGNAFSFGLFQVNALAHASDIVASDGSKPCQGVWTVNPNDPKTVGTRGNDKTLGSCLELDKTGKICRRYSATVTNQKQYETCKNYLLNPDNNITYAAGLLDKTSWKSWGADASCHF